MRPLWTQPLHTSASIPLDYASKGYVDGVLAIPGYIIIQIVRAKGGLHTFLSADILILSSPSGLLTGRIY